MALRQIKEEEWVKGDYWPVAAIRRTHEDLSQQFGFTFDDCDGDGLGMMKFAFFLTPKGRQVLLNQFLQAPEPRRHYVNIGILNDPATITSDLEEVLECLAMHSDDLAGYDEEKIAFQKHEVWRQDDYGNKFLVRVTPNRADAVLLEKKFTAIPHKQMYWIEVHHDPERQ